MIRQVTVDFGSRVLPALRQATAKVDRAVHPDEQRQARCPAASRPSRRPRCSADPTRFPTWLSICQGRSSRCGRGPRQAAEQVRRFEVPTTGELLECPAGDRGRYALAAIVELEHDPVTIQPWPRHERVLSCPLHEDFTWQWIRAAHSSTSFENTPPILNDHAQEPLQAKRRNPTRTPISGHSRSEPTLTQDLAQAQELGSVPETSTARPTEVTRPPAATMTDPKAAPALQTANGADQKSVSQGGARQIEKEGKEDCLPEWTAQRRLNSHSISNLLSLR